MDGNQRPTSSGRKVKYAPKAPQRRKERSAEQRNEAAEEDAEAQQRLLKCFNDRLQRRGRTVEQHSSVQVAIAPGATSTSSRGENRRESSGMGLLAPGSSRNSISASSTVEFGGVNESLGDEEDDDNDDDDDASGRDIKEYREPWDYNTYYPITLPLRRPYSGCPEMLDEAEFGKAGRDMEYGENTVNAASELGLLGSEEGSKNPRLLFVQLPAVLPLVKQSTRAKGKEKVGSLASSRLGGKGKERVGSTTSSGLGFSTSSNEAGGSQQTCGLENLPAGHMGKLLVYKSGAVKLKLGEMLFDVSPGSDCEVVRDLVVINTKEQHCSLIGPLEKQAVVTSDIDFLLDRESASDLN